jgi:twitching motility protein PilT
MTAKEPERAIMQYLEQAVAERASDLFIIAGMPVSIKVGGIIKPIGRETIFPAQSQRLIDELYQLAERSMDKYLATGDDDFSLSVPGLSRFRINTYHQRGSMATVIRAVFFSIPSYNEINIPQEVIKTGRHSNGMVLVTGPAGGGKSTTLACIINEINQHCNCHIITLEDPIEYLHRNQQSTISQREISIDTESYIQALRACLRQAPDVILLGEMRDYETIKVAMTAAETGHLLISTLHTLGAVNTIDRIIDVFPSNQQQQIRIQLSMLLNSVVSQQLLPDINGKLIPAFEIMHVNSAIRNMIREGKTFQIDTVIQTSAAEGMVSMDAAIFNLYQNKQITAETAIAFCINPEQMQRKLGI